VDTYGRRISAGKIGLKDRKTRERGTVPAGAALDPRQFVRGANHPDYRLIVEETRISSSEYRSVQATQYFPFLR